MPERWAWETVRGAPGELVGAEIPHGSGRTVRVIEPTESAFVLGSTQDEPDGRPLHPIVRRRSGGGGVLLKPGDPVWVDLIVPRDDPLWDDDIGRAAEPIGRIWAAVLARRGIDAQVHQGELVSTPWSRQLCFAGLGPGELTVEGRKVLGVSQRRTRAGACFQCALSLTPPQLDSVVAAGIGGEDAESAMAFLESFVGSVSLLRGAVLAELDAVLAS